MFKRKNINQKFLSKILMLCMVFTMFSNTCFAKEYIVHDIHKNTIAGTYDIAISAYHFGYCGSENGYAYHFNVYVYQNGGETANHHIFLDTKSGCWKDWESHTDITYGKSSCYRTPKKLLKAACDNRGEYILGGIIGDLPDDYFEEDPIKATDKSTLQDMHSVYHAIIGAGLLVTEFVSWIALAL